MQFCKNFFEEVLNQKQHNPSIRIGMHGPKLKISIKLEAVVHWSLDKPLNSKLKAIKRNEEVNKDDFYEDFYFKGIHLRVKRRKKPNMSKTELFDCTGKTIPDDLRPQMTFQMNGAGGAGYQFFVSQ